MAVVAVQQIRQMRGGAQSHLMLGHDRELYVVKFRNNPQGVRVLANEFLATRIAEAIGLRVPQCEIVEVSPWLIENTPELTVTFGRGSEKCAAGLQFGSKFAGGLMPGQLLDYLPEPQMREVKNLREFAGMLLVDKWTSNANGRQAVFLRRARERKYTAIFIDQGYCFGGGEWVFRDAPLRGVYARNSAYAAITGWEDFQPWLERVLAFPAEKLWKIAEEVPPEWYGNEEEALVRMVEGLLARRNRVEELVRSFRDSDRKPFPLWGSRDAGGATLKSLPEWEARGERFQ